MKITKELLERYAQGKCTEAELSAIEDWLPNEADETDRLSDHALASEKKKVWARILLHQKSDTPIIRFYKNTMRFTAAACIVFGAFVGGRLSANSKSNYNTRKIDIEEHLYVYGKNGYEGHLRGTEFKIEFDGTLGLYNASLGDQVISTGDTIFILQPGKRYNLYGQTDAPLFLPQGKNLTFDERPTAEHFSVLRTNKR